jgi:prepilin peptidase CpaA
MSGSWLLFAKPRRLQASHVTDFPHAIALVLAMLLVGAIATDLHARIIPNWLTLAVALLAVPWWLATGLGGSAVLLQIGVALAALALFSAIFALGMMGGGDVKLIAALGLWLPPLAFCEMLVWMALAGGALTIVMLALHRLRRAEAQPEIPYGVAISASALLVLANHILTSAAA